MTNKMIYVLLAIATIVIAGLTIIIFSGEDSFFNITNIGGSRIVDDMNRNQLTWNNVILDDHTVYNHDGSCYADNKGMKVYMPRCTVNTMTGRNIEQEAVFTTNRSEGTSYIFVYEGKLESGKLFYYHNYSHNFYEVDEVDQQINNYLVSNVNSYTDLGTPNASCQLGNTHNTRMYSVTKINETGSDTLVYCFTTINIINATSFRISGNITTTERNLKNGFRYDYDDITNVVEDITDNMPVQLKKNFSFYKINDVNAGEYKIKWVFTPKDNARNGKFHILAYPSTKTIAQAYSDNDYMYQDPAWADSLNTGLMMYHNFNTTRDLKSSYFNLTLSGADVNAVGGIIPNSIYFDGNADNYSTINNNARIQFLQTQGFTFNVWINTSQNSPSATYRTPFMFLSGSGQLRMIFLDNKPYVNIQDGGCSPNPVELTCGASCPTFTNDGLWNMYTIVLNSTALTLYTNGVYRISGAVTSCNFNATSRAILGAQDVTTKNIIANFDELGLWHRALSPSEILNDLYVGGNGSTYGSSLNYTITTTLNTPANAYATNSTSINFNFTIDLSNIFLNNYTLWVWYSNSTIYSKNTIGSLNISATDSYNYTLSGLTNNDYIWNVEACGNNITTTICDFDLNRTFIIDRQAPNITADLITNKTTRVMPLTVSFKVNASDPRLSNCSFVTSDNATINYVTCNQLATTKFYSGGYKNITYYANDSVGNINFTVLNFVIFEIKESFIHTSPVIEGESNTVYFNITSVAQPITLTNATFNYNGTVYGMTNIKNFTVGNNYTYSYSRTVNAPLVVADTYLSLITNFSALEADGNTTNYTQLVLNIPNFTISSSPCTTQAYKFTLYDEQNLSVITGDIDYNFYYGLSNSSLVRTFGRITGVSNLYVCFNNTISSSWILGKGEVHYSTSEHVARVYYLFENITFTNSTVTTELKDLKTSESTSFSFDIKSTTLSPYINYYTALLRWYPNLNTYDIVDMGLTDDTGATLMKAETEDVDYRTAVYDRYGNLVYLASPVRFVCQTSPCTYSLVVLPITLSSTNILKVQNDLSYNSTTKIVRFIYNDPTGTTDRMNLSVYQYTANNGKRLVCSTMDTGITGILTCNISAYTSGTFYASVTREASRETYIANLWIDLSAGLTSINPNIALFLTLIILMVGLLIGAGTGNPVIVVIFGIVSLIPALALGAIAIPFILGIIVLGGGSNTLC